MPASIELVQGDITALEVDAIVNAANEDLQLGAGVAGAIRRSGGLRSSGSDGIGHCPKGGAVVTGGGDLPAKWVIHAVGPGRGGEAGEETLLASAVASALQRPRRWSRVGRLPALSTGSTVSHGEGRGDLDGRARKFAVRARSVERIVFASSTRKAVGAFGKAREETASW